MTGKFGDKANDAVKIAHQYLAARGQDVKDAFAGAPPKLMVAVVDILNNNHNQFSKEDISPETGSTSVQQTSDDKLKEITNLRLSAEAKDPMHPDNKKTLQRIAELEEQLGKSLNK